MGGAHCDPSTPSLVAGEPPRRASELSGVFLGEICSRSTCVVDAVTVGGGGEARGRRQQLRTHAHREQGTQCVSWGVPWAASGRAKELRRCPHHPCVTLSHRHALAARWRATASDPRAAIATCSVKAHRYASVGATRSARRKAADEPNEAHTHPTRHCRGRGRSRARTISRDAPDGEASALPRDKSATTVRAQACGVAFSTGGGYSGAPTPPPASPATRSRRPWPPWPQWKPLKLSTDYATAST